MRVRIWDDCPSKASVKERSSSRVSAVGAIFIEHRSENGVAAMLSLLLHSDHHHCHVQFALSLEIAQPQVVDPVLPRRVAEQFRARHGDDEEQYP